MHEGGRQEGDSARQYISEMPRMQGSNKASTAIKRRDMSSRIKSVRTDAHSYAGYASIFSVINLLGPPYSVWRGGSCAAP